MIRKTKNKPTPKNMFETYLNRRSNQWLREKMAPYNPPNAHYSQMDVSEYDEDAVFSFIGKMGKKFYWLTHRLELDYLWYDKERKVIEIWGPYHIHVNQQAAHVIRCELEYFMKPKSGDDVAENIENVQTSVEAC